MKTLHDLFEETLKDIYFAEHATLKALAKMAEKADAPDLRRAFREHLEETESHVARLEEVFRLIGKTPEAKECPALKGLVEETEEAMREAQTPQVMDAALIGCAQAVEHYEMARYGTLLAWADQLELDEVMDLLEETLEQEEAADGKLSELAVGGGLDEGARFSAR